MTALRPLLCSLLLIVTSIVASRPALGADAEPIAAVRAIFSARCVECHGEKKQKSGLRLDLKAPALRGGNEHAPDIIPGKAKDSPLIQFVISANEDERMPPTGARLSAAEIAMLSAWIDQGAVWPETAEETAAGVDRRLQHWAFQALPGTHDLNAGIDTFVREKLAGAGLSMSPEADRRTLIRRAYFDVIGLPPSPEEVDAFVTDGDPLAYEKLVERLLASPRFGERWARHWLDVVRFAESDGFEMNRARANAWPYRDYVIAAFNADIPYDRFVREQLAGDALGSDAATGFLVGGPMDAVKSPDAVLTANQRADELHDMVSTTAAAFLGLTVNCARCHDHKFDPIPTRDYYALTALLQGVKHGERPSNPAEFAEYERRAGGLRTELADCEAQLKAQTAAGGPRVTHRANEEIFPPLDAKFVRFTITASRSAEPCIDELEAFTTDTPPRNVALADNGGKVTVSGTYSDGKNPKHQWQHLNDGKYGNDYSWISNRAGTGWAQIEFTRIERIGRIVWSRDRGTGPGHVYDDRVPASYRVEVSPDGSTWTLVASAVDGRRIPVPAVGGGASTATETAAAIARLTARRDALRAEIDKIPKPAMVYAGTFAQPGPTFRNHRGDPMQPRETVAPGTLSLIGAPLSLPPDAPEQQRRMALAHWIADTQNPLTARVIVNRLWHYHFGTGLVDTPSDFGLNGSRPTHPELLDWLAGELVTHGWSLKHMHRLILLSRAYRQGSAVNERGLKSDSAARLLWRFPPRRLEAEALRDAMLSVAGTLDLKMGGPGFDLFEPNDNYVKVYATKNDFGPAEFRRMVYQSKPRTMLDDFFGAFDCPDAGQPAPKRTSSLTPLQALNLLNGNFALQQAAFFAKRIEKEAGGDPAAQMRRAFRLSFNREPSPDEADAGAKLVARHGLQALCRALFNANEFIRMD